MCPDVGNPVDGPGDHPAAVHGRKQKNDYTFIWNTG